MYVAGIDAHATYLVVAIVSKRAELAEKARRIANKDVGRLVELLREYRPVEVVVETCPAWPWLHDLLVVEGHAFVLAHAKKLRAIAESNYKRDEIDAELLARMHLAGLIPRAHPKDIITREQAVLLRHRARLVRLRTGAAGRIHAELHSVGLHLERGRLLTQGGRQWIREEAWPIFGPEQRRLVRTHWALIKGLSTMIQSLDRQIERVGAEIPAVGLLRTIPGIGPYRGLMIATEVLPIERFPRPEHLVSYAGLAAPHESVRAEGHPPRSHPRWGEPVAAGRLREGRGQPRAARARELARALLHGTEEAPRMAGGTHRNGPEAGPGDARDAAHRRGVERGRAFW